jgi:hypothetical protein
MTRNTQAVGASRPPAISLTKESTTMATTSKPLSKREKSILRRLNEYANTPEARAWRARFEREIEATKDREHQTRW